MNPIIANAILKRKRRPEQPDLYDRLDQEYLEQQKNKNPQPLPIE